MISEQRDDRVNPILSLSRFLGERKFTLPRQAGSRKVSEEEAREILANEGCHNPGVVIETTKILGGEVYSTQEGVFLDIRG